FLPSPIWVERRHALCEFGRARSEILLEDPTRLINKKCHHTRRFVLRRIRDECKATDHLTAHDIIAGTTRCSRTLLREYPVVVPVHDMIVVAGCLRHHLAKPGRSIPLQIWPVESVLFAGLTDNALCVNARPSARAILSGVFLLRIQIRKADLDGVEFIAPDAAIQKLKAPGSSSIEPPHSMLADQRDWERKVLLPDHHDCLVAIVHGDAMLRIIGCDEMLAAAASIASSPDELISALPKPSTFRMSFRSLVLTALTRASTASSAVLKDCSAPTPEGIARTSAAALNDARRDE